MTETSPRVFISYTHDSPEHRAAVLNLANRLRRDGVTVSLDQFVEHDPPPEGFAHWCLRQIETAEYVLCVFTERYRRRFEKEEGGGATWEGHVLLSAMYEDASLNRKIVPIVFGGRGEELVPHYVRTSGWYDYPETYADLHGRLTRQPAVVADPVGPVVRRAPRNQPAAPAHGSSATSRRIVSADDRLLAPNRDVFIGRSDELARLMRFLNGSEGWATVFGAVTGSGGIGKTELCKAALREWLREGDGTRSCYYVNLVSAASASDFLTLLGVATGAVQASTLEVIFEQLRDAGDALFYLDNLESVIDDPQTMRLLGELKHKPGIRVLASSRVRLPDLGTDLPIGGLTRSEAMELFVTTWDAAGGPPIESTPLLTEFVTGAVAPNRPRQLMWNLGAHPLSIVLVATHGRTGPLADVIDRWVEEGTKAATLPFSGSGEALNSVDISIGMTFKSISRSRGAARLWALAALFPDGLRPAAVAFCKTHRIVTHEDLDTLLRYSVLHWNGLRYHILPPLARYAADAMRDDDFDRETVLSAALRYFTDAVDAANRQLFGPQRLQFLHPLLDDFPAIHRLVVTMSERSPSGRERLWSFGAAMRELYVYRLLQGRDILAALTDRPADASLDSAILWRCLGEVSYRLGSLDDAHKQLRASVAALEQFGDRRAFAHALVSFGDLQQYTWNVRRAEELFDRALALFVEDGDRRGQGRALQGKAEAAFLRGDNAAARAFFSDAERLFEESFDGVAHAQVLSRLADIHAQCDEYEAAIRLYERALQRFESERYDRGRANALIAMADAEARMKGVAERRDSYEKALAVSRETTDPGSAAALLLNSISLQEQLDGQIEQAIAHCHEARAIYVDLKLDNGIAQAELRLGDIYMQDGDVAAASRHYTAALEIHRRRGNMRAVAGCMWRFGELEMRSSRRDAAIARFEEARRIYEQENDDGGMYGSLVNMALIQHQFGSIAEAERLLLQIETVASGDAIFTAGVTLWMGDIRRRHGDVAGAQARYEKAARVARQWQGRGTGLLISTRLFQGDLQFSLGDSPEALKYYNEGVQLSRSMRDAQMEANLKRRVAELYLTSPDAEAGVCEPLLDETQSYYDKIGERMGSADVWKCRGDFEARFGSEDRAAEHYTRAIQVFENVGALDRLARALAALAELDMRRGRLAEAEAHFTTAASHFEARWEQLELQRVLERRRLLTKPAAPVHPVAAAPPASAAARAAPPQ